MIYLKDFTQEELKDYVSELGEKPFRAKQIYKWLYRGAQTFEEMTDLPESLQEKLNRTFVLCGTEIIRVQRSKRDGTAKYLLRLQDGNAIETVFMKYQYGNSICISSQAGCRMGCRFCASAIGGLNRNLTAGEMVDQILTVQRDTGERVSHVVIMGTGEPFDNYEQVKKFIQLIHAKEGLHISLRNITVSTCGLVPVIERFGAELPQVNLAISLHSADNAVRSAMMPVNDAYPIEQLLTACRNYTEKTKRRITFEYALVKGKNDAKDQIDQLIDRLRGMLCHVNLIPLNQVKETGFAGSNRKYAKEIADYMQGRGVPTTVRRELGADIDAACGQLRLSGHK